MKVMEQRDQLKSNTQSKSKRISKSKMKRQPSYGTLKAEHIEYITGQDTLRAMVGKSLEERAAIFNMKFSDVRITRS